jgi:hypothetical protein
VKACVCPDLDNSLHAIDSGDGKPGDHDRLDRLITQHFGDLRQFGDGIALGRDLSDADGAKYGRGSSIKLLFRKG